MTRAAPEVRRAFALPTPVTALSFAPGLGCATTAEMPRARKFPVRRIPSAGVWEVDARPHGRIRSVLFPGSTEAVKLVTEAMALEVQRIILRDIAKGVPEAAAVAPYLRHAAILRSWVDRWLEHLERLVEIGERSPRYTRRLHDYVAHWDPLLDMSIYALDYATLEEYAVDLRTQGMHATTAFHAITTLHTCLRWTAKRLGPSYVPPQFPEMRRGRFEPVLLTPDEQDAVLGRIREDQRGIYLAMCDLMVRPGEARALLVDHYDFAAREIHVCEAIKGPRKGDPRGATKEHDTRDLRVTERLAAWIDAHTPASARLKRTGELFRNPTALDGDHRWDENTMYGVWVAARDRAGVPAATMYSGTKHSTATWLRGLGLGLDRIGIALGHATPREHRVTEGYAARPRLANGGIAEMLDDRLRGRS